MRFPRVDFRLAEELGTLKTRRPAVSVIFVEFRRAPPGCWRDWTSQPIALRRVSQGYGDLAQRSKFAVPHQGIRRVKLIARCLSGPGRSPSLPSGGSGTRLTGLRVAWRSSLFFHFRLLSGSWGDLGAISGALGPMFGALASIFAALASILGAFGPISGALGPIFINFWSFSIDFGIISGSIFH